MKILLAALLVTILSACGSSDSEQSNVEDPQRIIFTFDFAESTNDFIVNTADTRLNAPENAEIASELQQLPPPFEFRNGIFFSWMNYTSSIKGFLKKEITGLKPNSQFEVNFEVSLLSNISVECGGVGGMPGRDVFVKSTLINEEPLRLLTAPDENNSQTYFVNIDDGQMGGQDVILLGNIGLPRPCENPMNPLDLWELKTIFNEEVFEFNSSATGIAWIYVSIDSGFSGRSNFYITEIEVIVQEVQ